MKCPRCNGARSYFIAGRRIYRCVFCKHDFSETSATDLKYHKKPIALIEAALGYIAAHPDASAREIAERFLIEPKTAYAWIKRARIRSLGAAALAGLQKSGV